MSESPENKTRRRKTDEDYEREEEQLKWVNRFVFAGKAALLAGLGYLVARAIAYPIRTPHPSSVDGPLPGQIWWADFSDTAADIGGSFVKEILPLFALTAVGVAFVGFGVHHGTKFFTTKRQPIFKPSDHHPDGV